MDPIKNQREQLDAVTQDGPPVEGGQTARDSVYGRRLERIGDHRRESQSDPNTLLAALGAMNADLFEIALKISDPLMLVLGDEPRTIDAVEEQTPAIHTVTRLAKQIGQFTQLELRLKKAASEEMTAPS